MKLWKKARLINILKLTEAIFYIFYQSIDTAEFLNLQGKLEPVTLRTGQDIS